MLQVCVSWIWIGIIAYLWGYAGLHLLMVKKNKQINVII